MAATDYCQRCDGYTADVGKLDAAGICQGCAARSLVEDLWATWGEERIGAQMGPVMVERFKYVLRIS